MSSKKRVNPTAEEISKMTFEEAYAALKSATEHLEGEEIDLESTLGEYAAASALVQHCIKLLDAAEERIRVLTESDGIVQAKPMQGSESD
jgi:exodeoxyribonuclease VII small subunit